MEIKRIIGGILMANCYIISPSPDRASAKSTGPAAQKTPCYIIDPGYDPHKIMNHIAESNLAPEGILLTHHHVDHSGNAAYLRKELDCPIMIHREDADRFREGADVLLENGDILKLDCPDSRGLKLQVLHTPGHTRGGVCFLSERERVCFTGDTIFNVDLGRTDLEDGSYSQMCDSILTVIDRWENDITIYPGHGDPATMKAVRKINLEFLEIVNGN